MKKLMIIRVLFALWLLALRWCSGEQSSESAAIPFGGIAQTSNVSVPLGMGFEVKSEE